MWSVLTGADILSLFGAAPVCRGGDDKVELMWQEIHRIQVWSAQAWGSPLTFSAFMDDSAPAGLESRFSWQIIQKWFVSLWLVKLLHCYSLADRMDQINEFKGGWGVMSTCFLVHKKQKPKERRDGPEPRSGSDDRGQETSGACATLWWRRATPPSSRPHTRQFG